MKACIGLITSGAGDALFDDVLQAVRQTAEVESRCLDFRFQIRASHVFAARLNVHPFSEAY